MTRYFSLIDAQVASFMKVLDHSIEMLRLGARLGEIEVLDIRQEMSDAEINDHIEKGRQHGLHEVCETEFEDQQIRARTELERMIVEPQVPNARIVPWSDLEASYGT
ncbi:MAG: hypothetical protein IT423_12620, partial [Pirellulaceae bacterium]|nr:hypothetical protein [Pirellulaceae bacterium]